MKIKSLLLFLVFFFSFKIYGQITHVNDSILIKLFEGKPTDFYTSENFKNIDTASYLIRINNSNKHLITDQPDILIMRKLDENFYIIHAPLEWVKKQTTLKTFAYLATANFRWKLSIGVAEDKRFLNRKKAFRFIITLYDTSAFKSFLAKHAADITTIAFIKEFKIFIVDCSYITLLNDILPLQDVYFVENYFRNVHEESILNGFDNTINKINTALANYPVYNGNGLTVSIKENRFDTTDIDLRGRNIPTTISSSLFSSHATYMATIIGGAGNSFYLGKGCVPNVNVSSADFSFLLPDIQAYKTYGISVQNHSYGVGIENYYGSDAAAYDTSMIIYPSLLQIFSAGNEGDQTSNIGQYAGINGFANLTGSFKMAKNILTVGSVNSFGKVDALSSKGPAYDGRIKPELVAFGEAGSSTAAAIASGSILMIQSAYAKMNAGALPKNGLIKALMINSASYIDTTKRISFAAGFGNVNAYRSLQNLLLQNYVVNQISQNEEKSFIIHLPDSVRNLKITLVWIDLPAAPNSYRSIVNDLDLKIENIATGKQFLPWVLNSYPNKDSLIQLPLRKRDSLNTVEQITVDSLIAGDYKISVKGFNITGGMQEYFVAYQWDTSNHFYWTNPAHSDNFLGNSNCIFRWDSYFDNSTLGRLEYSYNNNSWMIIDSTVSLKNGYYEWVAPDTTTILTARMRIGNKTFLTDTFTISQNLNLHIGYDCTDSVLMYWNKLNGVKGYNLYSLKNKYLTKDTTISDTIITLSKKNIGYPFFAVSPSLSNIYSGAKSFTINTTLQGVGCYIKNFLADKQNSNTVNLTLTLGNLNYVEHIYFEKLLSFGWTTLQNTILTNGFEFRSTDLLLSTGINYYRARIELVNGKKIYSDSVGVYSLNENDFLIFPNPVRSGKDFQILSKTISSKRYLFIYDILGRILKIKRLSNYLELIPTSKFIEGVYFIVIKEDEKNIFRKKLLIQ